MLWKVEASLIVQDGAQENVSEALSLEETVELSHRLPLKLPNNTVDFEVDLSTVIGTVSEVYINSNEYITVKRDDSLNTGTQCKVLLLSGTSLQKLYLSNASGAEATIIIDVGGES